MLKKIREVSLRNYLLFIIIIVVSIAFVVYLYFGYRAYETGNVYSDYLSVINFNEVDNYLVENKDAIMYVSISGDNEIRMFEKKFKKYIVNNSLSDNILYLDITNELKDQELRGEIQNKYGSSVPYIIIFNDGKIKAKFNIKDNNYDINLINNFLVKEGVISD